MLCSLSCPTICADPGPITPLRDAEEGTAARPGRRLALLSTKDADANLKESVNGLDQDLKVCCAIPFSLAIINLTSAV